MIWVLVLGSYIVVSFIYFIALRAKCLKNPVFAAPKSKIVFYILAFTWGLPTTLVGLIMAATLLILGYKPTKYGWCLCFEVPTVSWCVGVGVVLIATGSKIKKHEHGHCIQNIYTGVFNPLVIILPSAIRFWYRRYKETQGDPCKTEYESIWFEKSATCTGIALMNKIGGK